MKNLKKILFRLLIILLSLFAMNFFYKNFIFEKDIQKYSDIVNLVRKLPDTVDILYIGESSNITFRGDDIDKRPISGFLAEFYPGLVVKDITKPAAHAGIYKALLSKIPETAKIQTVIVTLNLRSFNAQWIYSDLETPLQKSLVLLRDNPPLVNRFLLSFKAYDIKSNQERQLQIKQKWRHDKFHFDRPFPYKNVIEWDENMLHTGIKNEDGSKNEKLTELACHYIKGYAFQIDTNTNPRIKDFNEIVKLAQLKGWNLVFNLLPENTEKAEKLVGNDLVNIMEDNRKLLINYYTKKGIIVVDNFYKVEDEIFIDQDWTTEHYREKGRKTIAENIAEKIKKYHKKNFKKADLISQKESEFFHNCDTNLVWPQMQTLTDEEAFSGKYSSKTGKNSDFSLTFEYPFSNIPDSLKNNISISCKIFQYSPDNNSELIIEISGNKEESEWTAIPISSQISGIKTWETFSVNYKIPEKSKSGTIIKIYLLNTSDKIVLLDDFRIYFN